MYIIQFGGYVLPTDQLDMSETQGATRRAATQALGGAGGSFDSYGLGPDPLAEDTITKAFIVEAASPTALQTALDSFYGQMMLSQNDWRQGTRLLVAKLPDNTHRATWAKCVEARAMVEYFHPANAWLPVQATFRRDWPVWWTYEDQHVFGDHLGTFEDSDAAGWTFGDGNLTSQAINSSPAEFTLTHAGNARVMAGLIEFDGEVTNPRVENLRNKHWFRWAGSLAAGGRFTLDIASLAARKNGILGEWPNLILGTDHGQLLPLVLEPGANPLRITSTSPDFTFRLYWARTWT